MYVPNFRSLLKTPMSDWTLANHTYIGGTPAHPASEFWAHRHVQEVETVDRSGQIHTRLEFSMAGREGYFFPFGEFANMHLPNTQARRHILMIQLTLCT